MWPQVNFSLQSMIYMMINGAIEESENESKVQIFTFRSECFQNLTQTTETAPTLFSFLRFS